MPWTDEHLKWLIDTGETFTRSCGKPVPIYEFRYDMSNTQIMSKWAKHFRNHYCLDTELPALKPAGMTNSDYLLTLKFSNQLAGGIIALLAFGYGVYCLVNGQYRTARKSG